MIDSMSQSSHTLPAPVRRARWRYLVAGVRDVSPILPGIVPFAMISGAVAVEAGIPPVIAMAMSVYSRSPTITELSFS